MPKYNDFKVGDVWIRRDGEAGTVWDIDKVGRTILVYFADDLSLWYHGSGRSLCKEDKYDLTHKKTNATSFLSIVARIAASQARVEGMKAKNAVLLKIGEPEEYGYSDFFAEAQLLEQLADEVGR